MSVVARNVPKLLGPDDPDAVGLRNAEADSPFLLICDHAGNRIPSALGTLGLGPEDLTRHIAYDIGILGVSELLADRLRTPLVFQRYSRLVVECNRLYASESLLRKPPTARRSLAIAGWRRKPPRRGLRRSPSPITAKSVDGLAGERHRA